MKALAALALAGCTATLPVKHVVVHPAVEASFNWGYALTERANTENAWCLYGTRSRDSAYVSRAEYPVVAQAGPHHIMFGCRKAPDYLGRAHSHNSAYKVNNPCRHSPLDLRGLDDKLSVVVCRNEREVLSKREGESKTTPKE
jgi:hypothetical protein